MESGVRNPEPKTPSPKRVTSRSSWRARRRPHCRRAIFSRTEFEPISTAASVGMEKPTVYMAVARSSPQYGMCTEKKTCGDSRHRLSGRAKLDRYVGWDHHKSERRRGRFAQRSYAAASAGVISVGPFLPAL